MSSTCLEFPFQMHASSVVSPRYFNLNEPVVGAVVPDLMVWRLNGLDFHGHLESVNVSGDVVDLCILTGMRAASSEFPSSSVRVLRSVFTMNVLSAMVTSRRSSAPAPPWEM